MSAAQCGLIAQVIPVYMIATVLRPLLFQSLFETVYTRAARAISRDFRETPEETEAYLAATRKSIRKGREAQAFVRRVHAVWVAVLTSSASVAEMMAIYGADDGVGDRAMAFLAGVLVLLMFDFVVASVLGVLRPSRK